MISDQLYKPVSWDPCTRSQFIMKAIVVCLFCVIILVESDEYLNVTYEPVQRQLLDFKKEHPVG